MQKIKKIINSKEKIACFTLDFELDYGSRINQFNLLEQNQAELNVLIDLFKKYNIPVSAFIRTDILTNYSQSQDLIKKLATDYHCHSHTHNNQIGQTTEEIIKSSATFKKYFGYQALGYRVPQGVLQSKDIFTLKSSGFRFSSSVFPSFRPGKFNNL